MRNSWRIAALLVVTFTIRVEAQSNDSNGVSVTFSDPSRPGLLKVHVISGSIVVKAHNASNVIVEGKNAAVRRRSPAVTPDGLRRISPNSSALAVEEERNVIVITNGGPFGEGSDLEVQVPVKTNLDLSTVNGESIRVEGVEGEIEVSNINGEVVLNNVAGSVVAHAMNGLLLATVRDVTPNKPMAFTSMNGRVDVTLPASIKANLKVRSDNDEVYSDFDIQLKPANPPTPEDARNRGGRFRFQTERTITGTINGGGADIEIRSFNAKVFLRKGKQ